MKLGILLIPLIVGLPSFGFSEEKHDVRPTPPSDIVGILEHFVIPKVTIKDFPLGESLEFIYTKYDHIEIDPPRDHKFVIEVRVPAEIIARRVTVEADSITMIDVIEAIFGEIPYSLIIEPGKLIFAEPSKS